MSTPTEPPEHLLEVGAIAKPHGLRGEVVVKLSTNVTERVAPGAVLWSGNRRLLVETSKPHQHRWIVQFEGVHSREAADALHGAPLWAEPFEDDDPDTLWIHELIGAEVVELDGTSHGVVLAVEDNPASDLLVLPGDHLVPLTFAVGWDDEPGIDGRRRLRIDPPAGLFDE